jgi:Leucine-rich repeat (LRR) protein
MPQNGIRPPGIEALTTAFLHNRHLRIVDLNDNTITTAAPKLASAIEKLPKLKILNLESSLIRTRGAVAVARAIVSHKNLQVRVDLSAARDVKSNFFSQELYLGCNDMHIDGGLEVARSVKNMPSLKVLDLNGIADIC